MPHMLERLRSNLSVPYMCKAFHHSLSVDSFYLVLELFGYMSHLRENLGITQLIPALIFHPPTSSTMAICNSVQIRFSKRMKAKMGDKSCLFNSLSLSGIQTISLSVFLTFLILHSLQKAWGKDYLVYFQPL